MKYSPRIWNSPHTIRLFNCYAYALNTQKHGWLGFCGALSGNYKNFSFLVDTDLGSGKITDPALRAIVWLLLDGLKPVRKNEFSLKDDHVVIYEALPNREGHWYRYDEDETISHKPGEDYVDNSDDRGKRIRNLETARIKGHTPRAENLIYCVVPKTGLAMKPCALETHEIFAELAADMRGLPDRQNPKQAQNIDVKRRELFKSLIPVN